MLEKKSLRKLNFAFSLISILLIMLAYFGVQFNNISISNVPTFEISLLSDVNTIIRDFCGLQLGNLIVSILSINICYYVFVVLPFSLFNWVRGLIEWRK